MLVFLLACLLDFIQASQETITLSFLVEYYGQGNLVDAIQQVAVQFECFRNCGAEEVCLAKGLGGRGGESLY